MKNFDSVCYKLLKKVPTGKVVTYGQLARAAGNSKASRAVGNAMKKNPFPAIPRNFARNLTRHPISPTAHPKRVSRNFSKQLNSYSFVPCHRVIKSDGSVGGFAFGQKKKIELLKKEGVEVAFGKIDLRKFGFNLNNF